MLQEILASTLVLSSLGSGAPGEARAPFRYAGPSLQTVLPRGAVVRPLPRYEQHVQVLAHEVERSAARLTMAYRRQKTGNFFLEASWRRGLAEAEDFELRAAHFHEQVERHHAHPRHTQVDFLQLMAAHGRLSHVLPGSHGFHRVRREFEQVRLAVEDLSLHFGHRMRFGPPAPRHAPRPAPWNTELVQELAHRAERQASRLAEAYHAQKTGNFFKEASWRRGYEAVECFVEAIAHLHEQLERRFAHPRHTDADFRRMLAAWDDLERILPVSYRFERVHSLFDRLRGTVEELAYHYEEPLPRRHR